MNVLDIFSLNGKVALITGGAGIYGRQIVTALAEAGAQENYIASRGVETFGKVAQKKQEYRHDATASLILYYCFCVLQLEFPIIKLILFQHKSLSRNI